VQPGVSAWNCNQPEDLNGKGLFLGMKGEFSPALSTGRENSALFSSFIRKKMRAERSRASQKAQG